jgi:hypothetical protein
MLAAAGCLQVQLLVVCAGYQKLDSLQDLDFEDLDTHWQVREEADMRNAPLANVEQRQIEARGMQYQ